MVTLVGLCVCLCARRILLSISFKQKVTGIGDGLQVAKVWGEGFKSNSWLGVFVHVVQRGTRRCLEYGYVTTSVGSM